MTFTPAYAEGLVCATHVTWCLACEKQLSFRLIATRLCGGGGAVAVHVTFPLSVQLPAGAFCWFGTPLTVPETSSHCELAGSSEAVTVSSPFSVLKLVTSMLHAPVASVVHWLPLRKAPGPVSDQLTRRFATGLPKRSFTVAWKVCAPPDC